MTYHDQDEKMLDDVKAVAEMFGVSVEPLEVTDPSGKKYPALMLKDQHIRCFQTWAIIL